MSLNDINLNGRMLFVDMDNTLIVNPFDVDITGDLPMFFRTWASLKTQHVNDELIDYLRDRPFTIFTNRGADTEDKIREHLKELSLIENITGIICCAGKKSESLSIMEKSNWRKSIYLIDNAPKYQPDVLVSGQSLKIINN